MSRVHLTLSLEKEEAGKFFLNVTSSDFSEKANEKEVIGKLTVDVKKQEFHYSPIERLRSSFCPPEYFEKYSGDIDAVDRACEDEGFMCTAWSYRIYIKAKKILDERAVSFGSI